VNRWQVMIDLLTGPVFWLGLVAYALAVAVLVRPLAGRLEASRVLVAAALVASGFIIVLTAPFTNPSVLVHLDEVWQWDRVRTWPSNGLLDLAFVDLGFEGWLNVVLFVPAGFLWSVIVRRWWAVFAALVMYAIVVETIQAGLLVRVADVRDVYANALGAGLGVLAAFLRHTMSRQPVRGLTVSAGLVLGFSLVVVTGNHWLSGGADRAQSELLSAVQEAFRDSTSRDVLNATDNGGYLEFGSRPGVAPDYLGEVEPGVIEARYRIDSQERPRCVMATWTQRSVDYRADAGDRCRRFVEVGVEDSSG
jgi:hypothetical protein